VPELDSTNYTGVQMLSIACQPDLAVVFMPPFGDSLPVGDTQEAVTRACARCHGGSANGPHHTVRVARGLREGLAPATQA